MAVDIRVTMCFGTTAFYGKLFATLFRTFEAFRPDSPFSLNWSSCHHHSLIESLIHQYLHFKLTRIETTNILSDCS